MESTTIEGTVVDDVSKKPISGLFMSVDGIKSPTGVGILTDGRRENAGQTVTDISGYYKMRISLFVTAERLEFSLNSGNRMNGYVYRTEDVYLTKINKKEVNKIDFLLSPTTVLKINFKNINPVSDSDFFYFGWYSDGGNGWTKGLIGKENCGTVMANDAITWTGKNVCGTFTVETIAEAETHIYWTVKKNGVTKNYSQTVFVKRDTKNEFYLNY